MAQVPVSQRVPSPSLRLGTVLRDPLGRDERLYLVDRPPLRPGTQTDRLRNQPFPLPAVQGRLRDLQQVHHFVTSQESFFHNWQLYTKTGDL